MRQPARYSQASIDPIGSLTSGEALIVSGAACQVNEVDFTKQQVQGASLCTGFIHMKERLYICAQRSKYAVKFSYTFIVGIFRTR